MDWEAFFTTCTDDELSNIHNATIRVYRRRYIDRSRPLDVAEIKALAQDEKFKAIKMYRDRNTCSLLQAKYAVEKHMEAR